MSGIIGDNTGRGTGLIKAAGGGGKVLQVVTSNQLSTQSISGSAGSWVDLTSLTADITPATTSSRILILAQLGLTGGSGSNSGAVRIMRDSTAVGIAASAGSRPQGTIHIHSSDVNHSPGASITYVDSPSSTSAITYKLQMNFQNGTTGYINRSGNDGDGSSGYQARAMSSFTVIEIGA